MATTKANPKSAGTSGNVQRITRNYEGLSREQLIDAYRIMYTSRKHRRPRDHAEAAAENIFSDFWGGTRSDRGSRGFRPESRLRLVLSLLSRPRALPRAGRDSVRNVLAGRGRGR